MNNDCSPTHKSRKWLMRNNKSRLPGLKCKVNNVQYK